MNKQEVLREKIINALKEQGFKINPHIRLAENNKAVYKSVQSNARIEQILLHKEFLKTHLNKIKKYCRDGSEIVPENIKLELREVKSNSLEADIFSWWNLAWWSIPYQHPYGRQMRFILWDKAHNAPFGLISLQSPVLKMSVRDNALGIPREELDIWVNKSMNAQRVGALPPYNELLGGKLVALTLASNEIRESYKKKYSTYTTLIKKRFIDPELLFITTTSAFGRSSLYNRLKYRGETVAESLGYTRGSGTFHIPQELYLEILGFLNEKGIDISRGYGHGPSRKLKLISIGLNNLGLPNFAYHGIKREFFLFSLVKNLIEVIQHNQEPIWVDRPFDDLADYWKERWEEPRAERIPRWKEFKKEEFFKKFETVLEEAQ